MNSLSEIAVVGAGAWGTALAAVIAGQGRNVVLVARDEARALEISTSRRSPHLPGILLPKNLHITGVVPVADITLLCSPMQFLRATISRLPGHGTKLVMCCKGVERDTLRLSPEIADELVPDRPCAVLTGPNFAHEIAANLPAAAVLAARDPAFRSYLIEQLATPRWRLYGSTDPVGAALGGAAKNVIAIAAGAVIGFGLGENARAALITRGLAEIARLADALGGSAETVVGLAGLGDLILTATGSASRNYRAGLALGRGEAIATEADGAVIEGVSTAPALRARAAQLGCEMPVTEAVADLLAKEITIPEAMARLLSRAVRDE